MGRAIFSIYLVTLIFQAKNYTTRQDLENAISKEVGLNMEENRLGGHVIQGSREELKRLYLSDLTTVFGISCTILDKPTRPEIDPMLKKAPGPVRGERHKSALIGK